jgi:hypothetical protein
MVKTAGIGLAAALAITLGGCAVETGSVPDGSPASEPATNASELVVITTAPALDVPRFDPVWAPWVRAPALAHDPPPRYEHVNVPGTGKDLEPTRP